MMPHKVMESKAQTLIGYVRRPESWLQMLELIATLTESATRQARQTTHRRRDPTGFTTTLIRPLRLARCGCTAGSKQQGGQRRPWRPAGARARAPVGRPAGLPAAKKGGLAGGLDPKRLNADTRTHKHRQAAPQIHAAPKLNQQRKGMH